MALLYPWATKEYLLWNMTIGQIILYHNKGLKLKYGDEKSEGPSLLNKSAKELREMKDKAKAQAELEKSEANKAIYKAKYGAI